MGGMGEGGGTQASSRGRGDGINGRGWRAVRRAREKRNRKERLERRKEKGPVAL